MVLQAGWTATRLRLLAAASCCLRGLLEAFRGVARGLLEESGLLK
jgi:hypothetical protein